MRVAHVNQDPGTGPERKKGAAIHVDAIRRAFEGLDVDVVCVDAAKLADASAALARAHADGGIDLIYERYALQSGPAFQFAERHDIPFVLEVNAPLESEAARYRGVSGAADEDGLTARMFRGADLVLTVSTEVADYALRSGASPERVKVHPNGVDPERFRPLGADRGLRQELVGDASLVLGFHGRLRPWHNLSMLVSCARRLLAEGVDLHLLLIGEGDYDGLVSGALPAESYTTRAWVPHAEIGNYVACFDALVMTHSARAPFYFSPLKLFEAMAAEVVPVVPRLGDMQRLLTHGKTAWLFEPDSEDSLAEGLRALAESPALRRELGENARKQALGSTWENIVRDVLRTVRRQRS